MQEHRVHDTATVCMYSTDPIFFFFFKDQALDKRYSKIDNCPDPRLTQ